MLAQLEVACHHIGAGAGQMSTPPRSASSETSLASLMMTGDLVKLVSLKTSEFIVRATPRSVLYGLTFLYVAGYALILALEYLR